MQSGKRSTSHIHETPDEEAENTHSQCLRREDQTAPRSAADAENLTHSQRLCREDLTALCSAAAIKKSKHVNPALEHLLSSPLPGSTATES